MKDFIGFNGDLNKLSKKDLELLFIELKNYKLTFRDSLGISGKISFGTEIEFEDASLYSVYQELSKDDRFHYWQVVKDDSCTKYINDFVIGGEVISPILHDLKIDWQLLNKSIQILKKIQANPTDRTSLHVHVGNQIFGTDIKNVIRFVKVWCIFEHIIFKFAYGKDKTFRPNILYFAHPIAEATKLKCKCIPGFFEFLSILRALGYNKKWAINFANYYDLTDEEEANETIEIRVANGSLDENIIQNTINLYLKLMIYVSSDRYDEELIDRLFKRLKPKSLIDYDELCIKDALKFADLIFDNNLDRINFLRQYVKDDEIVFMR